MGPLGFKMFGESSVWSLKDNLQRVEGIKALGSRPRFPTSLQK